MVLVSNSGQSNLKMAVEIWFGFDHSDLGCWKPWECQKTLVLETASSDRKPHAGIDSVSMCLSLFLSILCSSCCYFYKSWGVSQVPCQGINILEGQEWDVEPSHLKSQILVWTQVIWKLSSPRISICLYLPCMIKYSCQDILPCMMRICNVTSLEGLCCRCTNVLPLAEMNSAFVSSLAFPWWTSVLSQIIPFQRLIFFFFLHIQTQKTILILPNEAKGTTDHGK